MIEKHYTFNYRCQLVTSPRGLVAQAVPSHTRHRMQLGDCPRLSFSRDAVFLRGLGQAYDPRLLAKMWRIIKFVLSMGYLDNGHPTIIVPMFASAQLTSEMVVSLQIGDVLEIRYDGCAQPYITAYRDSQILWGVGHYADLFPDCFNTPELSEALVVASKLRKGSSGARSGLFTMALIEEVPDGIPTAGGRIRVLMCHQRCGFAAQEQIKILKEPTSLGAWHCDQRDNR